MSGTRTGRRVAPHRHKWCYSAGCGRCGRRPARSADEGVRGVLGVGQSRQSVLAATGSAARPLSVLCVSVRRRRAAEVRRAGALY